MPETSDAKPLMPKATAVWLVDNTALTFEQIAELCQLHMLEVKGIADGDVAQGIRGKDPITGGELTREEIRRGEEDSKYRLKLSKSDVVLPPTKAKKPARYTPTSRRQDRPNAIIWLLRNHAELKDAQIIRLVGTTKPTIAQIRDRTHWNSANLVPQDPVTLGLCSQIDLDNEVQKAAVRVAKERAESGEPLEEAGTLESAAETTGYDPIGAAAGAAGGMDAASPADPSQAADDDADDARVLEQLKQMSAPAEAEDEAQPRAEDVFAAKEASEPESGEPAEETPEEDAKPEEQPERQPG
ncbi:MAG: cell cycle transcriptional regulator TrcR [Pseudomonadota bacterium]